MVVAINVTMRTGSIESDDECNDVGPGMLLEASPDYQIPARGVSPTESECSAGAHNGLTGDFGRDLVVSRQSTCDRSVQTDLAAPPQSEMYRKCHHHLDAN